MMPLVAVGLAFNYYRTFSSPALADRFFGFLVNDQYIVAVNLRGGYAVGGSALVQVAIAG